MNRFFELRKESFIEECSVCKRQSGDPHAKNDLRRV